MGHGRKRMYTELPEAPTHDPRQTRNNGPTRNLEAAQQQRLHARSRMLVRFSKPAEQQ